MIWIGGHLRKEDYMEDNLLKSFENCIKRELSEELKTNQDLSPKYQGFVYDITNIKSRQHLGVVFISDISDDLYASINQQKIFERTGQGVYIEFSPVETTDFKKYGLENWSLSILKKKYSINLFDDKNSQISLF
jgi:predicted NUDIX family phosphoesterase